MLRDQRDLEPKTAQREDAVDLLSLERREQFSRQPAKGAIGHDQHDVSSKALTGLLVFLVTVTLMIALNFRT